MSIQKMDAGQIKIGPCWASFKGYQLGSIQGGVKITNENTSHEVKVDQTGEEILAEIMLGGGWSAEVPTVEINKGLIAAICPGAEGIEASAPYVATNAGATGAGKVITFTVALTGIKVGDAVHYTNGASASVVGHVGSFDLVAKQVTLSDDDDNPKATGCNPSLYTITSVNFHNATGVNLLTLAGELIFVPKDANDTDYYIFPSAGLMFQPDLGFLNDAERKITLKFKGYPNSTVLHSVYGTGMGFFLGSKTDYDGEMS